MSLKQWAGAISLFAICSTQVSADQSTLLELLKPCAYPEPPTLVDASTATKEEVEEMGVSVRTYLASIQTSLVCIDDVEKANASSLSAQDRETINAFYNNGVDQLNFFAEEYNKQVAAYNNRSRMPEYEDIGAPERDPAADLWRQQQR